MKRLSISLADCGRLPDGVVLWITWIGGNGPYCYELQRSYGQLRVSRPGQERPVAWLSDAAEAWVEVP